MPRRFYHLPCCLAAIALISCGDDKGDKHGGGHFGGQQGVLQVTADFSGAVGLLVIDTSGSNSNLRLQGYHNASLLQDSDEITDSTLVKVESDGEIKSALTTQGSGMGQDLPKVQTIAVAPNKDIYLHFERPFLYRQPDDWSKAWDPANGFQCQIFKVKGGNIDELRNNPPAAGTDNLECIDNLRFVDSWQAQRNSVFQFDAESNVYYPGAIPNGHGKMVVYKRTQDGSETKEMINANICVEDFLITKNGGVFYTGNSQCSGGGGSGGGFFRYVSPESEVREIARDWWNFVFEPITGATGDQAVFFGPDPRSSTTASWDSACLFRFDPTLGSTAAESINESITCGGDIWSWINMSRTQDITTYSYNPHSGNGSPPDAWITEFTNRCTSENDVFAGGGSQISSIKQDSEGEVYVIGQVRIKKKGEVACSLVVKGPHCVVNGIPYLKGHDDYGTSATCTSKGGSWLVNDGYCSDSSFATYDSCLAANNWTFRDVHYHNVPTEYCGNKATADGYTSTIWDANLTVNTGNVAAAKSLFHWSWLNCQPESDGSNSNNNNWTNEYKGLAKVDPESKTLVLLSSKDEQAINLWLVDDVPYYSTYNTTLGQYLLKRYNADSNSSVAVATNFEAYNIAPSNEANKVFYDGLDFSTNAYSFGSMFDTAPYERTIKQGLTGTVKTIVILPE